ncbi:MAG: hypothetical protein FWD90_10605 [Defluviitaleaceae bacterium]|nr:hypothetical protein [Defluviitaleaceae bacterium]
MEKNVRNWTVFIIGGQSGAGKSTLAYGLSEYYGGVNVLEFDDIAQAVMALVTAETHPVIFEGKNENWQDSGVEGNRGWLLNVSKAYAPALKAVVERHVEDNVPVIIEGDFIDPQITLSFGEGVKTLFTLEPDEGQLIKNFQSREGGDPQTFRAAISAAHGAWLRETCEEKGIPHMDIHPWDGSVRRAIELTA